MMNCGSFPFRYVFRRLRFLGNKTASHILTLVFLSLWHGFYVGYLILFALEFLMLVGERQVINIFSFFLFNMNCFMKVQGFLFQLVERFSRNCFIKELITICCLNIKLLSKLLC